MQIKRYFSDEKLSRIKNELGFLFKFIKNSFGEYDFAIRDGYFNLYYKGNSLAKIEPTTRDLYKVTIHKKFFEGTTADNPTLYFSQKRDENYYYIQVNKIQFRQLFKGKHLAEFSSMIKKVNNGEEINFEQTLITDNLDREDMIIIDRQISDSALKGRRLDLLALQQKEDNEYNFLILEVKLGKNRELADEVASQLSFYVEHIKEQFKDYKYCYEKNYQQKRELGLFENMPFDNIKIIKPVEGMIVVGGYSGMASPQIKVLKDKYPHLKIKHFVNKL